MDPQKKQGLHFAGIPVVDRSSLQQNHRLTGWFGLEGTHERSSSSRAYGHILLDLVAQSPVQPNF